MKTSAFNCLFRLQTRFVFWQREEKMGRMEKRKKEEGQERKSERWANET